MQRDWTQQSDDPLVKMMRKLRIPITRDNYLDLAYFGDKPKELDAEQEAELPQQLQQRAEQ